MGFFREVFPSKQERMAEQQRNHDNAVANEAAAKAEVKIEDDTVRVRLPGKEQFVTFKAEAFRSDEGGINDLGGVWTLDLVKPTSLIIEQQQMRGGTLEHREVNQSNPQIVWGEWGEDVTSHYGYTNAEITAAKTVAQSEYQKVADQRAKDLTQRTIN